MSGICGVWNIGGQDIDQQALEPALAWLKRRGPDGSVRWSDGPIALGHSLLATTPEALFERLPLTDQASGCTITADARLDNREELLSELAIDSADRIIGDGELILHAYLRWGKRCSAMLLGDFAFAIWDPRLPHLFCARDHMGMRQLIYHHDPGRLFAFATHSEAVIALDGVPRRLNEARIADFLDNLEAVDRTSTFFEQVFRLPAAHTLTVNALSGLSLERYWTLEPGTELKLPTDEAYAAAFLEVFTEAVRCRLRSPAPVGSMLSGGMDSGSVVAVAARLLAEEGRGPLLTFSSVGKTDDKCVETEAILSAARLPGLAPTFVAQDDIANDRDTLAILPAGTEPFDSNMTLVRAVYLAAHRAGVRVMLDGAGGDVVLTAGNRVAQLLRQGRLLSALNEARAEKRFWGKLAPTWKTLLRSSWAAYVPVSVRRARQQWIAGRNDRKSDKNHFVSAEFASRVDLAGRRKQYRSHLPPGNLPVARQRALAMVHPHMVVARERYDRLASAFAIEPRDPFMDLRVINFCLSLPPEQVQANGWPKLILRRAMRDRLPADVIWRRGKEHLGWAFTQTLFTSSHSWKEELQCGCTDVADYLKNGADALRNHPPSGALALDREIDLFFLWKWLANTRSELIE